MWWEEDSAAAPAPARAASGAGKAYGAVGGGVGAAPVLPHRPALATLLASNVATAFVAETKAAPAGGSSNTLLPAGRRGGRGGGRKVAGGAAAQYKRVDEGGDDDEAGLDGASGSRDATPTSERTVAALSVALSGITLSTASSAGTGRPSKRRAPVRAARMAKRMARGKAGGAAVVVAPAVAAVRLSTDAASPTHVLDAAITTTSHTAAPLPVPAAPPTAAAGGDDMLPTLDGEAVTAAMSAAHRRMSLSVSAAAGPMPRGSLRGSLLLPPAARASLLAASRARHSSIYDPAGVAAAAAEKSRLSLPGPPGRPTSLAPSWLTSSHITVRGHGGGVVASGGRARPSVALLPALPGLADCGSDDESGDDQAEAGEGKEDGGAVSPSIAAAAPTVASHSPPDPAAVDTEGMSAVAPTFATALSPNFPAIAAFLPWQDLVAAGQACRSWACAATTARSFRVASAPPFVPALPPQPASGTPDGAKGAGKASGGGRKGSTKRVGGKAVTAAAPALAEPLAPVYTSWTPMLTAFPWGRYLADGACKTVHKVWCAPARRFEAVSVMDVSALEESGNRALVQAEIQIGCLLSQLVADGACPNFVSVYQVYRSAWCPERHFPAHWGTAETPPYAPLCPFPTLSAPPPAAARGRAGVAGETAPPDGGAGGVVTAHLAALSAAPLDPGCFQYQRMELCDGGDVEGFLRGLQTALDALEEEAVVAAAAAAAAEKVAAKRTAAGSLGALASGPTERTIPPAFTVTQLDTAAGHFAASLAFQMVYSMHVARHTTSLRHHDVKALNFLVASLPPATPHVAAATPSATEAGVEAHNRVLEYAWGEAGATAHIQPSAAAARLPLCAGARLPQLANVQVVKMADFGTAETEEGGLGTPIRAYHFTTFENAPPEYVLMAATATQGYASDTWALGLVLVHALTGGGPYEETMGQLTCPPPLKAALMRMWTAHGASHLGRQYAIIARLIREVEVEDGEEGTDDCLANTLYRCLVLTGVVGGEVVGPVAADINWLAAVAPTAPAAALLLAVYHPAALPAGALPNKAVASASAAPAIRYGRKAAAAPTPSAGSPIAPSACTAFGVSDADAAALRALAVEHGTMFSLAVGAHPALARARRRSAAAAKLPGGCGSGGGAGVMDLAREMLALDPHRRPTMRTALHHPAFACLRADEHAHGGIGDAARVTALAGRALADV